MARSHETKQTLDLHDSQYYFNRELSWLAFNARVLHEAVDSRTPLLERLKFLGIFSSNLDEFFMVRVAILKDQVEAGIAKQTPDGRTPAQQLADISATLRPLVKTQHDQFQQVLRPLLVEHGVHVLDYADRDRAERQYLKDYFEQQLYPVLTPLAVDPAHPFPRISNLSLNLAVIMRHPSGQTQFARVKVPNSLPRFVPLPEKLAARQGESVVWAGVPLEQVVAHNLELLFTGMEVLEYAFFRITRDAEIELQEELADDLLTAVQEMVRKRHLGESVVRLEIQATASERIRETLMTELDLADQDVYDIDGLLNLRDLMSFLGLPLPHLKDPPWTPQIPPRLAAPDGESVDIFAAIRDQDLLVHHPYESFTASVEQFITQAAHDPQVLALKMTLYRTSGDSPIVQALIDAAGNGKQVAALVELKARFDEENNITWAQTLEEAGVHVVYGIVGLKTHTKIVLVVRQEGGEIRRYVHIGTGNYNPKTARLYTDLGLLSGRPDLGEDLTRLFNALTGYTQEKNYRKLLVSPVNLRDRMMSMIQRETAQAQAGKPARIIAKMNSLVDDKVIRVLYEASQAGVEIDLIIRGICCLRPGVPGVSENIRVSSIIGRYLEHSRIFWFHNDGAAEVYMGSADWMPRNLDRRVEAITPVEDPALVQELKTLLDIFLADNRQAWDLQADGTYQQRQPPTDGPEKSAQVILMQRTKERCQHP